MSTQRIEIRMARFGVLALVALLLAGGVSAQQTIRGQFILPGGATPSMQIRFYLTSGDGLVNEYRFSDSNGRFILERLRSGVDYTITVEGDGSGFGRTVYSFQPSLEVSIRIFLREPESKPIPKKTTVSASSGYKPTAEAAEAYELARKAFDRQKPDEAERLLRKAIAADEKYAEPRSALGVIQMQQRRYGEAAESFRQALELDPKLVQAQLNLGITLHWLGKYSDSIAPLREAVRLQENQALAHLYLGGSLVELDRYAEAERQLEIASTLPGVDEAGLNLFRGKLYALTGKFDEAIAALQAYLAAAPNASNAGAVKDLIERIKKEQTARR